MSSTDKVRSIRSPDHQPDGDQLPILTEFESLLQRFDNASQRRDWLLRRRPVMVEGIYLWGGVGRGKTWMMDLFFDSLVCKAKQRYHFHRFMEFIHAELKRLQGQKNPLQRVVRQLSRDTRILCLDEFNVTDIGDAMILAGLLRGLFDEGITLVTTSNKPPDAIYQGGIQRSSFLPAIELLKQRTRVLELGGSFDYRRQVAEEAGVYHTPLDRESSESLKRAFTLLADEPVERDGTVSILSRNIPFRYRSGGIVWFDFDALCGPPRSQSDYIEVARQHHTVIISDIPRLDGSSDDRTRRFIFLIDEFYDRRVKVLLSANAAPEALYCGERLAFEFQRTSSRLQEMQTADYLSSSHLG